MSRGTSKGKSCFILLRDTLYSRGYLWTQHSAIPSWTGVSICMPAEFTALRPGSMHMLHIY
jgi:hypothetical protein